jgi:hypothetical protein
MAEEKQQPQIHDSNGIKLEGNRVPPVLVHKTNLRYIWHPPILLDHMADA